ncbi:hypothetical protein EJ03DRAFT_326015 [Teratosphaeria nubilosa]|uniref:Uncharacterized protein n=1 Tax=Teratosphaeria nubilosa TaxID=161662 RepID=A0A6G1LDL8_9PEZI|nr:hypothetical protein EJ03DRAFT_326015 [Teratosphaeria nubilosa]
MRVPTLFLALLVTAISFCSADPCDEDPYSCACCQSECGTTPTPSLCVSDMCGNNCEN